MPTNAPNGAARAVPSYHNRMSLRVREFCEANGMSYPTFWRKAAAGEIKVSYIGKMPVVARAELIRLGLIAA